VGAEKPDESRYQRRLPCPWWPGEAHDRGARSCWLAQAVTLLDERDGAGQGRAVTLTDRFEESVLHVKESLREKGQVGLVEL
jgi:hypothetical protein